MSNHRTKIEGNPGAWRGECSCSEHGEWMRVLQQAEDWIIAHEAEVARARARVGKRVSLKSERDWYLLQAENMANAEPERILWKRLADELTTRLGDTDAPSEGDETLW